MRNAAAVIVFVASFFVRPAVAFEGRMTATVKRGNETSTLIYTVGTNCLRVARGETDQPYTVNLVARDTGVVMLLFPCNCSWVRLNPPSADSPVPPGVGPQASPSGVGNAVGVRPVLPMMPPPMAGRLELVATGDKTNLFGFACTKFELGQRGETMEIWATDRLPPFQPYLQNRPLRFGSRTIEGLWGNLLKTRRLFPLRAVLKFENGAERLRFEVRSVESEKIEDQDGTLFQPPPGYWELPVSSF